MSKQPFFTLITCTRNSSQYLPQNLASVQAQKFADYEHLFVDGRSTDGTQLILANYQKKSPRARIHSATPSGIAKAMNDGITHAKGRYLLFLNSDDYLHDELVLTNLADFLARNPKLDWLYGQIQVIEENNTPVGIFPKYWFLKQSWYWLLQFINFVPHQAVCIHRDVFTRHGLYDPRLKYMMDPEYWLRIGKSTRWTYLPRLIACYRLHSRSATSSRENRQAATHEYQDVQSRHLSPHLLPLAKLIYFFLQQINRTYR